MKSVYVLVCALLGVGCGFTTTKKERSSTAPYVNHDSINRARALHDRYYPRLHSYFDSLLISKGFSGSILVAKNGQVLYEKYAGTRHFKQNDSITSSDAFHLASVSKTFTGMAILKLWEEGRLGLDDSLEAFFPEFPYKGVTVKTLLNHRSGLPNYTHYLDQMGWDKRIRATNEDVLQSLYTMKPPRQYPPDRAFNYCNTNYALLALIIERVSGLSYANFLKSKFFEPLGMNDTYVFSLEDSARAMPSYEWNGRSYAIDFLDLVYGDKNVYSTVQDLLKWDQALYGEKLFKQATLEAAFTPYSFEKPGIKNYGFGWRMFAYPTGQKIIYHNGWWHGNNTVMTRLIEDSATIIILGNRRTNAIYKVKPLFGLFGNYDGKGEDEME
ncbi:MAG TPA: serine hydrolase domain-containing protein [Parasegetibacter sp.]